MNPAHTHRPALAGSAVASLQASGFEADAARVAIPRPEIHLVARFGASARDGLDVHILGVREKVQRKMVQGGQLAVVARLRLGASRAVIGVPAAEVAGQVVALADVWGASQALTLCEQLAEARSTAHAASILGNAIDGRVVSDQLLHGHSGLAVAAAERLKSSRVNDVAAQLGVSERQLRRLFHEAVGMSPKVYARLMRFRRAIRAAREDSRANWADVAALAGYYDQAHLIEECRALAGVTPRALLSELQVEPATVVFHPAMA